MTRRLTLAGHLGRARGLGTSLYGTLVLACTSPRRTATSQVYGGLVWGVGMALLEETEVDSRFGGFLNNNLAEYQVPVNGDVRNFEVEFIDEPDPQFNSLGYTDSNREIARVK
jgi:molybdopterin-binding aldehyde dehydrogenase-like protein